MSSEEDDPDAIDMVRLKWYASVTMPLVIFLFVCFCLAAIGDGIAWLVNLL